MRDYQRKKTKYILPNAVYNKTLWTIRDYHRVKDEVETMIAVGGGNNDGPPIGAPGDPTYKLAVKYADYVDIVNAIETAKENIPQEYREGIWQLAGI